MNSNQKKILVLSSEPSHPAYSGNRICILNYVQALKELGYEVYFLWIANFDARKEEKVQTAEYWKDKLFVYHKNQFHRVVESFRRILHFKRTGYYDVDDFYPVGFTSFFKKVLKSQNFDSVIINYIFYSKVAAYVTSQKTVLFTHDVFTNKFQHTGSKWFSVTANDEAKALNRVDTILAIQENEAIFYKYLTRKPVLTVYSYFPLHPLPFVGNKNILYIAGPNQYNLEAITWFIDNVFTTLSERIPGVKLIVGGRICSKLEGKYGNLSAVSFYGDVEELAKFYSLGDIVINPTFNGTGLKIKTFEALAFSKVVVCHSHNQIGIFNEQNAPLFIADDVQTYLEHFSTLFSSAQVINDQKENICKYMSDLNNTVKSRFAKALEIQSSLPIKSA
ncbi:MAG: glycosyltransferase [Agriterribacter sp.]